MKIEFKTPEINIHIFGDENIMTVSAGTSSKTGESVIKEILGSDVSSTKVVVWEFEQ